MCERPVGDHHVDRPGVEAQQCVKLTGTNRSIGLYAQRSRHVHGRAPHGGPAGARLGTRGCAHNAPRHRASRPIPSDALLRRPGGHGEGEPPDPIPNSAVKPFSADGTAS